MAGIRYTLSIEQGTLTSGQQALVKSVDRAKTCQGLMNLIAGIDAGNWRAGRFELQIGAGIGGTAASAQIVYSNSAGAQTIAVATCASQAGGVLLISSGAGSVGGTIGGTLVTATWASTDANSADLVAAAINANATVKTYAFAASRVATGTLTISSGSGAVGGTINGVLVTVTWASTDTASATALALKINQTSGLSVIASSSAGVVTLWATTPGTGSTNTGGNAITLVASGAGVTASAATLTGGGTNANVLIQSLSDGTGGLGVTLVASGTGVTASTGANLVGGANAGTVSVSFTSGATDTLTVQNAITALRASAAMCGVIFVPTPPSYGATINTAATLTLWAATLPTGNGAGNGMVLSVTGTGATIQNPVFAGGVNATANGFNL